jgi:PhzF family phenazine biosynthesis protein
VELRLFQVDAFASEVFRGNPAAVVPLDRWLEDRVMQSIAAENNLSETAFIAPGGADREIRWFTPKQEVDLCGHATLASAYVLFEKISRGLDRVTFGSKSGPLTVTKSGERLVMEFPSRPPEPCPTPHGIAAALGATPIEVLRSTRDLMCVFEREEVVRTLRPDPQRVLDLGVFAVIATAPGASVDFVSRFFAPAAGISEDPVTGSAHCTLTPYWAKRLDRAALHALQVSERGGELWVEDRGEHVTIAGRAALYLEGTIRI